MAPTAAAKSSTKKDNKSGQKQAANKPVKLSPDQRYYAVDAEKLTCLQEEKPWMKSAIYFQSVAVSPSAVTKMMMHCASGVEKGIAKGGNPIEVMGLLLGRPDPHCPTSLIVTDAFPLPIEGFETRVIADDQAVVNHMISLNECLERTRKERFMGWYHSHPFDLGELSHCFLSQTDLSTQLQWQRAEDPHGNPFVAIVLDPLRSVHLGKPELKAFRAYPPEYQSSITNECPDGTVEHSEQARLQQWGSCWNRYYELSVNYYMSSTSRKILGDLTQNYLWMAGFKRQEKGQKVKNLQELANGCTLSSAAMASQEGGISGPGRFSTLGVAVDASDGAGIITASQKGQKFDEHVQKLQTIATQELSQATLHQAQRAVFKTPFLDISSNASS